MQRKKLQNNLVNLTVICAYLVFFVAVEGKAQWSSGFFKPEKVRLIYFLPKERRVRQGIDTQIDILIKRVQRFYAEQMERHGFGRKTFEFETDETGKAVVRHVTGKFNDTDYHNDTDDKVMAEINEQFNRHALRLFRMPVTSMSGINEQFNKQKHLHLIVIDIGSERIDNRWCGIGGFNWSGGGWAIIPASGTCFAFETAAHELGHAFGLAHDFRSDTYIMSYGRARNRLSHCAAKWLDASRFFNPIQTTYNEPATIRMLESNATTLRFEAVDTDRLHQVHLIIPTAAGDPTDGVKLHSCKSLDGEINRIEFIKSSIFREVTLRVIDKRGNCQQENYSY